MSVTNETLSERRVAPREAPEVVIEPRAHQLRLTASLFDSLGAMTWRHACEGRDIRSKYPPAPRFESASGGEATHPPPKLLGDLLRVHRIADDLRFDEDDDLGSLQASPHIPE